MSHRSDWKERFALSLRVGAMVALLGFVVLAAEQRLGHDISPVEVAAGEAALPFATPQPVPQPEPAATPTATPASPDYFPSHFPAPTGEDDAQPPTF
jgi:hypothetical protein